MKKLCVIATVGVILAGVCVAQSPHPVEVVAEVGATNQTGRSGGVLFTPNETGMFRVSLYLQCTQGDAQNGHGLSMTLRWLDDVKAESFTFNVPDTQKGPPTSYVFVIKGNAGASIGWNVVETQLDTAVYEVYAAVERIGPKVQ